MPNGAFGPASLDTAANWFVYARVSSEEQKKKKSVDSQVEDARRLLPDLSPDHIFTDEAVSGSIPFLERPRSSALFAKLREEVRANRTPCLMVQFIDRLGRDAEDTIGTYNKLMKLGIRLMSPYEGCFDNTADSALRVTIFAGMAQYVKDRILAGARAGMKRKAERGEWTGGPMTFGYRIKEEVDTNGKRRNGRLVIDNSAAAIIRDIYKQVATGKSGPEVARYLDKTGVPTPRQNINGKWTKDGVRGIITNTMYKGVWLWGRRRVMKKNATGNRTETDPAIERKCPPIISDGLWERANAALKANRLEAMTYTKFQYLLRGLIHCGVCGKRAYGGRGYSYVCRGREAGCKGPIIHRAELDDSVWSQCEAYICNPGKALRELEQQMAAVAPERDLPKAISKLEARLAQNAMARERARRQEQEGHASREEFLADMKQLAEKRDEIQSELYELKQKTEDHESQRRALGEARTMLETLRQNVRDEVFTFEDKRRIVRALVAKVEINQLPANAGTLGMEYSDQIAITFRFQRKPATWPPEFVVPDSERREVMKGLGVAGVVSVVSEATLQH
jgi:site-specific DNA recombinase